MYSNLVRWAMSGWICTIVYEKARTGSSSTDDEISSGLARMIIGSIRANPGRFGPGSFWPGSFRPGLFRPNFGVGRFGLGRWVDLALGRFGRSLYQNVDGLGQADKQIDE